MKTQEQMRKEFYAFINTLPKRVGETPESVIADWWLSQFEAYKEELRAEVEKLDEYIAVKDNDAHRYQIPRSKQAEWDAFLEIPEDDERSWDVPEWAERIDGMPVTPLKERVLTLLSTPVPEGEVKNK